MTAIPHYFLYVSEKRSAVLEDLMRKENIDYKILAKAEIMNGSALLSMPEAIAECRLDFGTEELNDSEICELAIHAGEQQVKDLIASSCQILQTPDNPPVLR